MKSKAEAHKKNGKLTHTIIEGRQALAVVGLVLFEQVDEVKNAVAFSANENVRLSHFLLCS